MQNLRSVSCRLRLLIPLGVLVAFLALFKSATVNYLGSSAAWYAVLAVVTALLALQMILLALGRVAERTEPAGFWNILHLIRRRSK